MQTLTNQRVEVRKLEIDLVRARPVKTYHVHTALVYANNKLHIGHAYELALASALAEYLKS